MFSSKVILAISILFVAAFSSCDRDPNPIILGERCYLLPDPGVCNAAFPKYYYDQNTKSCKQFIWGGCGGVVPFNSRAACEQDCMGK